MLKVCISAIHFVMLMTAEERTVMSHANMNATQRETAHQTSALRAAAVQHWPHEWRQYETISWSKQSEWSCLYISFSSLSNNHIFQTSSLMCYLSQKSSPELARGISTVVVDLEEQPLSMLQGLLNSKLIKPENRDAECILQALNGECITFQW